MSARAGATAPVLRSSVPATLPSHMASSFANASALKGKVALGNAHMSRIVGGGAKAYKRCASNGFTMNAAAESPARNACSTQTTILSPAMPQDCPSHVRYHWHLQI